MIQKPTQTPKQLIVEARRAEAAAVALEQDLAGAHARGAAPAELATLGSRAQEARAAAAAKKAEHDEGLAGWEAFRAAEDAEARQTEAARIAEIQRRVWPEGRP